MNKRVNFEDDFFILAMRIRMVKDIITLDADPELFLKKTLDDIYFIDQTLRLLLEYLEQSPRLFERDELLEKLSGVERQFFDMLDDFIRHDGNLCVGEIPSMTEKLDALRNGSLERRETAERILPSGGSPDSVSVVSHEELAGLLQAF